MRKLGKTVAWTQFARKAGKGLEIIGVGWPGKASLRGDFCLIRDEPHGFQALRAARLEESVMFAEEFRGSGSPGGRGEGCGQLLGQTEGWSLVTSEDFGFYSERSGEPLEGFDQSVDMI